MATIDSRTPMDTRMPPPPTTVEREEMRSAELMAGGSLVEAVGGVAGVVLAILGLVLTGFLPVYLAAIAVIAVGFAMACEGAAIAGRYSRLLRETGDTPAAEAELGGGMTAEFLGGIAGIVLGILALLQLVPMVLLPVAAIVFGAALLLGCGATARLNHLVVERFCGTTLHVLSRPIATEAVRAASGAQVLVGLGAIVLGILGLVPAFPTLTLALVAFLAAGASLLLSGAALSGKFLSLLRRW